MLIRWTRLNLILFPVSDSAILTQGATVMNGGAGGALDHTELNGRAGSPVSSPLEPLPDAENPAVRPSRPVPPAPRER